MKKDIDKLNKDFKESIKQKQMSAIDLMKNGKKEDVKRIEKEINNLERAHGLKSRDLLDQIAKAEVELSTLKLPKEGMVEDKIADYLSKIELRRSLNERNNNLVEEHKILVDDLNKTMVLLKERGQVTPEKILRIDVERNEEERKDLLNQIAKMDADLKIQEKNLTFDLGPSAFKRQHTTNVQIDYFLNKIGLSDNLIKSNTQLIQSTESPMDKSIKNMNRFITELEDLKKEYNELNIELPRGEIKNVTSENGILIFTFADPTGPNEVTLTEFSLPKAWLDKLKDNIENTYALMEREKALDDIKKSKDEKGNPTQIISLEDVRKFTTLKENVITLLGSIYETNYLTTRNLDIELEPTQYYLNHNIWDIKNLQNELKVKLDEFKRTNQINDNFVATIGSADEQINMLSVLIEKLNSQKKAIQENELLTLYVTNNEKIDRLDQEIKKLSEVKDPLEQIRDLAVSALALPKAIAKSQTTIEEFRQVFQSTAENLNVIIKNVNQGIFEFDSVYDQYTEESWEEYLNDLSVMLEDKASQFKEALEGEKSMELQYKLSASELEGIKGFDESTSAWKGNLTQNYEDVLKAVTHNYEIVKDMQKRVEEKKLELKTYMGADEERTSEEPI
ncbi:MAG: hypothetical protein H0U49_08310 [Parachlamydiaceae bacterium]|nr:hypothetical protein [Parachlamydiaceae bacterium]